MKRLFKNPVWLVLAVLTSLSGAWAVEEDYDSLDMEDEIHAYESPLSMGLDLQYCPITYNQYALTSAYNVADISSKTSQGFHLAIEWLALKHYGKLGVGGGTGFSTLYNASLPDGTSGQFNTIPFEVLVSYRFDYLKDQMLVPFVKAGFEYTLTNFTKSDRNTGWEVYPGIQYGFGGQFLLNRLEMKAAKMLDAHVGINNTYLIVEYLLARALDDAKQPNLARNELRMGLRFEY